LKEKKRKKERKKKQKERKKVEEMKESWEGRYRMKKKSAVEHQVKRGSVGEEEVVVVVVVFALMEP
jgi:hypothetical protein